MCSSFSTNLKAFRILPIILAVDGLAAEEAIGGAGSHPLLAIDLATEDVLVVGGRGVFLRASGYYGQEEGCEEEDSFHHVHRGFKVYST